MTWFMVEQLNFLVLETVSDRTWSLAKRDDRYIAVGKGEKGVLEGFSGRVLHEFALLLFFREKGPLFGKGRRVGNLLIWCFCFIGFEFSCCYFLVSESYHIPDKSISAFPGQPLAR